MCFRRFLPPPGFIAAFLAYREVSRFRDDKRPSVKMQIADFALLHLYFLLKLRFAKRNQVHGSENLSSGSLSELRR